MNKKKTNDEFLKELEEKGRFDIQPLEEYKGAKEKILCKCLQNEDHDNFHIAPTHLLSGEGCPKCGWEKLCLCFGGKQYNNLDKNKNDQDELNNVIVENETP